MGKDANPMKLEVKPASTGWSGVDASAIKLVTTNAQTSIKSVYVYRLVPSILL